MGVDDNWDKETRAIRTSERFSLKLIECYFSFTPSAVTRLCSQRPRTTPFPGARCVSFLPEIYLSISVRARNEAYWKRLKLAVSAKYNGNKSS